MKHVADIVRLPSCDDSIAPVRILDADGRVVRVISAEEFRRDHATVKDARPAALRTATRY
jgi:hypothetical protein